MTAIILLALFGGLCWAGRSRRSYDTYYDPYIDSDCDDLLFIR